MVREIKAAPLLFGYRGSDPVDVAAVEDLIRRVAQLKIDLPQVSSLDLMLVLAGAEGVTVLTPRPGSTPVADPRSDLFVRRLNQAPATPCQTDPPADPAQDVAGLGGGFVGEGGFYYRSPLCLDRVRMARCEQRRRDPGGRAFPRPRPEGAAAVRGLRVLGARQRADGAVPLRLPRPGQ